MKEQIWSFFNSVFFKIRNLIRFQKDAILIESLEIESKLNLYYGDLMKAFLTEYEMSKIKAVDIGSKNFFYASSFYQFYVKKGELLFLDGIEIDAFRRYQNFRTRYDYARYYTKDLVNVNYYPMDFLDYEKKVNVVTMFLPFVFKEPLLNWGLSLKEYQPERIMEKAYELLEDSGIWIISNQGILEQKKQHEILDGLGISYENKGIFESDIYQFKIPHYITIVKK